MGEEPVFGIRQDNPGYRALLLDSKVSLGILLKLSVFTEVEITLPTSWSYRVDNMGSWVREACGPQPIPFSLQPIPISPTLHGPWSAFMWQTQSSLSSSVKNPRKQLPLATPWVGPCTQASTISSPKGAIWAGNSGILCI